MTIERTRDEAAAAIMAAYADVWYVVDADDSVVDWSERSGDHGESTDRAVGDDPAERSAGTDAAGVRSAVLDDSGEWSIQELIVAEDVSAVEAAIETARSEGNALVAATTVAGETYDFLLVRMPTAPGRVAVVAGELADLTGGERSSRAVLDRMSDAFYAVDREWRLTYVNERAATVLAEAMTGSDAHERDLVGLELWEAIPDAVDTAFYDRLHEAMTTQEPVTVEERYEPLDAWFEVRAYPSPSGLTVFFRDVTDRRQRESDLRNRERVMREIYDITADRNRTFEERVQALLAVGRAELDVPYATLSRIDGDEYVFEYVATPADDDTVQQGDVVPLSWTNCERAATTEETLVLGDVERDAPDLAEREGNVTMDLACYLGAPVFVDEEVYGTFCFYGDRARDQFTDWEVTLVDLMAQWLSYECTRRRSQERLERQNERLDEFASVVSHDLRNPLNVIAGSLQLARETGDESAFDRAERGVEQMEALIDDLLALARSGETATDLEPVVLRDLVESCWTTVEMSSATLRVETEATVLADGNRLRQLFENLFRNAVEHAGPTPTVTVGDLDDAEGFYVADDGPGIDPADGDRVFEAGFSTAEAGTGFGLDIVQTVAAEHDWTITLTDGVDGGARFEFAGVEPA